MEFWKFFCIYNISIFLNQEFSRILW